MNNNQDRTIFIHATNVHNGGGKSLLNALLSALPAGEQTVALLDTRMTLSGDVPATLEIKWVKPNILHRLSAELWLQRNINVGDTVLCFGNLPPLFGLRGRVILFLQNRYLIDPVGLENFPFFTRLRLFVERFWLRHRVCNVDTLLVQTPSMQRLAIKSLSTPEKDIEVLPFVRQCIGYQRHLQGLNEGPSNNFLYVASGEPHKNHYCLIEAWCHLADEGLHPLLLLTLDELRNPDLIRWIQEKIQEFDLRIHNLGALPHSEVLQCYKDVDALIYPSTFESFGIPLIEARQAGLAVLASELDYVRDVLDPDESFDPASAVSIARAVKRFMLKKEEPLPLVGADGFLKKILERNI